MLDLAQLVLLLLACWTAVISPDDDELADQPPSRYELVINGENFTVDEGQVTTLESQAKPGVRYTVGVRFAQYQRWNLNGVGFEYQQAFAIRDNRDPQLRSATLKHPLGFSMVVTDLGGTLSEASRPKALKLLIETTTKSILDSGAEDLRVSKVKQSKFRTTEGLGVVIHYQYEQRPETALVYVLTNPQFACTCVVQFLESSRKDVLSITRPTFDSFEPIKPKQPKQ